MSDPKHSEEMRPLETIEPERYEVFAPPAYHFELERRDFLKVVGGGIGVFLVMGEPAAALAQESGRRDSASAFRRCRKTSARGCISRRAARSPFSPERWKWAKTFARRSRSRWRKS